MSKFSDETSKLVNDKINIIFDEWSKVNPNLWKEVYASNSILPPNVTIVSTPPQTIHFSNIDDSSGWIQEKPELPKREGLHYITSHKELREGDLILMVDHDYNESVERVKCVDMGVWTEGLVDGEELFETQEELDEYKWIVLLNRS